jgi:cytochrome oxidase Cu insertion factor (SCO1/SenC/PrrC family)
MWMSRPMTLSLILISAVLCLAGCQKPHSAADPVVDKPSKLDGQQAPRFTLPSNNDTDISLADFTGKSKLVLIFYRGYW